MGGVERFGDLGEALERPARVERTFFGDEPPEVRPFHVAHGEEEEACSLPAW
jgi:hypothetical protein